MRCLILAVLFAIAQTPSPVPRKASASTTDTGHSVAKDQAKTSVKPTTANTQENPSGTPQTREASQPVIVRELPPVSIVKDLADWGIWAFSGLLVVVGFLQWYVIRAQANLMRKHAEHLENLASAARDNAKTAKASADALVSSERAWVLVESAAIAPAWYGKSAIRPLVKNFGRTVAKIRKISLGGARPLQLKEELPIPPIFEGSQELDFVLSPNGELPLLYVPTVPMNNENLESVKNGILKMCVYGLIEYLDFAGNERVTGFCLIYNWGKNDVPPGFYPYLEAPPDYNKAT